MTPVNRIYLVAFLLFVVTAILSAGFFHVDEHFQLVEFANYKLGTITADALPWEFEQRMRPTFQVAVTYGIFSFLKLLHIFEPYSALTVLRLVAALLSFWALYRFTKTYQDEMKNKSASLWFIALSFFLWYVPFLSARFSSETFSTIFLLLAITYYPVRAAHAQKSLHFWLAGLFLGLSFISRYQMGFMIGGLFLWAIFVRKTSIKHLGFILGGFSISLLIGLLCDYWFYGEWTLSAYHYFYQNLVENKASEFGTSPVWFYAQNTPLFVFPLFGIVIVPCILLFFVKQAKHPFTWMLVPFILIHHIIAHKETRFLFPLAPFIPFIVVYILQSWGFIKKLRFLQYPFWVLNLLFLTIMSLKPAYDNVGVFRYIYHHVRTEPVYFMYTEPPFRMYLPESSKKPFNKHFDLTMYFYYRNDFQPKAVDNLQQLDSCMTRRPEHSYMVLRTIKYETEYGPELSRLGYTHHIVYQTYHSYFRRFNYFNWMSIEDVGVWTIVEVDPKTKINP